MKKISLLKLSMLLSFTLLIVSCVKDNLDGQSCPDNLQGTKISLLLGEMQEIETRSAALPNENKISDAYLLVFGSDGKYKTGEKVDVDNAITNNGQQRPTLTTGLSIASGDSIALVVNTGVTFTNDVIPLMVGTSTMQNIKSLFPFSIISNNVNQNDADSGKGLPMSGAMKFGTDAKCNLYRAVAKIQLELSTSLTGVYAASMTNDNTSWTLKNIASKGMVYSPRGEMEIPASPEIITGYIRWTPGWGRTVGNNSSSNPITKVLYFPEYPNATLANGTAVANNVWNAGRMCMIIDCDGKFYRIDMFDRATGKYIDIKRNYHYKVIITKVNSLGYDDVTEAAANPGSNLEYEVLITGDEDNFITSNGQYSVTTDKSHVAIFSDVTTAEELVKFRCEANGVVGVTTRKVRLVGADKSTVIPTTQLQMCKSDGTAIAGNVLNPYTSDDEAGYQLKFTSPDVASLPDEQVYVEICYGNIRHYVPVNAYVFNITAPAAFKYDGTETKNYTVQSYKKAGNTPVAWTATEFSTDGGATWTTTRPAWLTSFTDNAAGSATAQSYNAKLAAQVSTDPHNDALKTAKNINERFNKNPYNLSNSSGAAAVQNTANCYIVNAPGDYSLPLVYGNAIKNGLTNSSAYDSEIVANNVLEKFIGYSGDHISAPYIYDDAIGQIDTAVLVWQDAENLVTAVNLSVDKHFLTFTVPQAKICQGNAVVAVRNASNQVLWSWHIWVTDYNPAVDHPKSFVNATGYTYKFMPVNIGWCDGLLYPARLVKVRFTQAETSAQKVVDINQLAGQLPGNSLYYQWGRKDPFVGSKLFTSTGNIAYPSCTTDWTATGKVADARNVITNGILNPGTYCANSYMDYYYYNLWSATCNTYTSNDLPVIKTIYDPSPVGYHMPAGNAFTGFTTTGSDTSTASQFNQTGNFDKGWTFSKAGSDDVFFPAAGYRNYESNAVYGVGSNGSYWVVVPGSQNGGRYLGFGSGYVSPLNLGNRAYGFPVRCVAE